MSLPHLRCRQGDGGTDKIQGIGANFVPQVLDTAIDDELLAVTDQDAFAAGRLMARTEGVLVGISSERLFGRQWSWPSARKIGARPS